MQLLTYLCSNCLKLIDQLNVFVVVFVFAAFVIVAVFVFAAFVIVVLLSLISIIGS